MKNHWIKQSVNRQFNQLQSYVEGLGVGLTAYHMDASPSKSNDNIKHFMVIGTEAQGKPSFEVKGNPPPAFKKAMNAHSTLDHVAYIYLRGPSAWSVKYCVYYESINVEPMWSCADLPDSKDPVFCPMIKRYLNNAIVAYQTARKEKEKCEEPSSS